MMDGESEQLSKILCDSAWRQVCRMETLLHYTRDVALEHAFTFCAHPDGRITSTPECEGTQCSVNPPSCPEKSTGLAVYHTHPSQAPEFSPGDYLASLSQKHRLQCLGITKDGSNHVRCEKLFPEKITEENEKQIYHPLMKAHEASAIVQRNVMHGLPWIREYSEYDGNMLAFHVAAQTLGLIEPCAAPVSKGAWQRPFGMEDKWH